MRALTGDQVQCRVDGMFEPRQCRINSQQGDDREISATCTCVRPEDGNPIPNTMQQITRRDQAPDCETRGKEVNTVGLL